ncbi:MAG: hypothetical protein QF723_09275, partial [Phycisphaerales bacterium]|nr:hypothetical protein [Phycisphaerales bacterium]
MEWQRCPELDERTPLSLMAAWPRSTPLAMLHTNPADVSGRWSVLGVPSGHIEANATSGTWRGPDDLELQKAASLGALAAIDAIDARRMTATLHAETPPFAGWIACLHYELGEVLEPAVRRAAG